MIVRASNIMHGDHDTPPRGRRQLCRILLVRTKLFLASSPYRYHHILAGPSTLVMSAKARRYETFRR